MSDRLLYVALILSFLGLALLVFASDFVEPPYVRVGDVNTGLLEKNVHLKGKIASVHEFKGGSVLISLSEGNSSVDVYLERPVAIGLDKKSLEGRELDLVGTVQLYEGRLEVLINKPGNLRLK